MSMRSVPSLVQVPRNFQIYNATGVNTTYQGGTPTGVVLAWVAGPNGSDLWDVSITPTATVTTANQMQFFASPDGGTTYNLLPFGAVMATYTMAQTTALPITHITHPNTLPMGPSNPWVMGGISDFADLPLSLSGQTEPTSYYRGGVSFGTTNAQTLPYCYNSAGSLLGSSPGAGTVVDFTAGSALTNTTTATIAPGAQTATAIKRASGTNLSASDITAGFRYRMFFDGTEWILLLTPRLYFAMGQSQGVVVSVTGADR